MTTTYRILYVDDEPALLEVVRLYLEKKKKFAVDTATSAGEALEKLQSNPPYDAIVSDYQMPVMDGIEFLKVLRRRGDDTPFIIFTGKGREDVVIQALNEGADFYLQKGGDPASQFAELGHIIEKVAHQKRIEASIRDMERREADILNFLPDATFAIDLRGTVIAWNRAMEKMTGVVATEILGKGNYEYAIPFYRERRPILIDLVLAADPGTEAKYPYIRREGDTLISEIFIPHFNGGKGAHLWFLSSPLYDSGGKVVGAIESIRDVSEWKNLEEEFKERERFLSTLISNLPGFAFRCRNDRDWTMEFVSDGCIELTGYTPDDLVGNATVAYNEIIRPEFRDIIWEVCQEDLRERRVFEYEYPIVTRSGETRWVLERSRGVFDGNGNLLYLEGFITDITSRKNAEIELRKSQEQLALAIEGSGVGLWDWKVQTGELAVNERWADIGGWTLDDLAPITIETWYRLAHPDDLELSFTLLQRHFNRETSRYECEVRIRHKDGHWVWVLDRGKVTEWDGSGRPVRMTGTHLDITERKRIEEKLRESKEMLRNFIENLPVGLYRNMPGSRGEYLLANPYVARMHGYGSLDELLSSGSAVMYENPAERVAFSDELVREGRVFGRELRLKRKNGESFWARVSAVAVRDENGNVKYFDGIIEDITEQKRAEEALRQANRKITLLDSITRHDINNQILVLTGFLDLLQDSDEASERAALLEKTRRAADRILATIRFTRDCQEIGGSVPRWQDVHELVETARKDFVSQSIEIENDIPPGVFVFSDPMMARVISNLVDNAIRHGGNATSVRFSAREEGDALLLACEDDGVGIPDGEKEKIFERGYGKNTGWGLFLVQQILAITGMTIRETGQPGKGARFLITVPRGSWKYSSPSTGKKEL